MVDGDTVHARVDLGFDVRFDMKLRLYGINAPEMRTPEGKAAKEHLYGLLVMAAGLPVYVTVVTQKDRTEKYGRYLASLFLGGINLNRQMVDDGFAVEYML